MAWVVFISSAVGFLRVSAIISNSCFAFLGFLSPASWHAFLNSDLRAFLNSDLRALRTSLACDTIGDCFHSSPALQFWVSSSVIPNSAMAFSSLWT